MYHQILMMWAILLMISCGRPEQRENIDFERWGSYWFQGNAEISSFDLMQYRYGEAREGTAVLVYVTEDFSRNNQVKLDDPRGAGRDAQTVLKLNQTRNFITGIYPYSMMTSVFTPVRELSQAVKITSSVQEWCGQSFIQLNLSSGNSYTGQLHSYFEQEGDESFAISGLAEDDLWNLIRIDPDQIPIGGINVFPSMMYQRFTHQQLTSEEAFIRIQDITPQRRQLELTYGSGKRTLKIDFRKEFPHEIMAWEEIEIMSNGQQEVSRAERKAVKVIDYWTRNSLEDEYLRRELQLQ
ncbi:hypothetical protein EL17_08075 [Anditalea andensis]|uniref:Septum formation inhibitor Maf n=1 Tax=Anditalea andensis TaxID=1048983 RepID=A0A074LJW3_9BACT|nr:hypothetical protein EL17_08075 [Anditalea andensis]